MKICLFYHSLVSDWNHGNAHFLRGVCTELQALGHDVHVFEPRTGWSRKNLIERYGVRPLREFHSAFPGLRSELYDLETLDLDAVLDGVDLVIAHEWNEPELIEQLGRHRNRHPGYRLLFHDTHHRGVTAPAQMVRYNLRHYDGVLAFGEVLSEIYRARKWASAVWTWHEAADTRIFRPMPGEPEYDLVWVGNWGDDERSEELFEFLLRPVKRLGLRALVHGVRYPDHALQALDDAGIRYGGWLPNYRVPQVFANARLTIHVPRRPYVANLPGIPTIRPFEAMACGIPLICSPWDDVEHLFHPGLDYLIARDCGSMESAMGMILESPVFAARMSHHGRSTILSRHTCAHRVQELLTICDRLGLRSMGGTTGAPRPSSSEAA